MSATIQAGRRKVEISRPDKPLFPSGITKLDLARYYEQIAPVMVPHIRDRPLNLERYPDGIEGERIIQQRASRHFPDWIKRVEVGKKGGSVEHVIGADAATLVYLAGQAAITLHPWLSRRDALDRPDRLIVDLDPTQDDPTATRRAAQTMVELVRGLGLEPFVMTTGSRGYHVTVPLERRADFDSVRALARDVAAIAAKRHPRVFTDEQRKAKREGRILVDVMRNGYAHTAVAPYAVRARPGAPVATPLRVEELKEARTRADHWTIRSVLARVEREGDPWREIVSRGQRITEARKRVAEALGEAAGRG